LARIKPAIASVYYSAFRQSDDFSPAGTAAQGFFVSSLKRPV
jgi:hypothetical protein